MKRDMDLVREILLKLEDRTEAGDLLEPEQVQRRNGGHAIFPLSRKK